MIRRVIDDDLDLRKIADSGQCFRWTVQDERTVRIIAAGRCLYAVDLGGGAFAFDCDDAGFADLWHGYFDLDEDYAAIRGRIDPAADPFLWRAAEHGKGIRILRQDPWETLVSFIISQNRNIPAIRRSVELLCEMCGTRKTDARGGPFFAFPEPERIAALSEDDLKACKLGYRWRYVREAARTVLRGGIDLPALSRRPCSEAVEALCALDGVGPKVAGCVALFGLHQPDAFPRDVWINRVLRNEYPGGFPFDRYSPYNGVYQQYMFAYYRDPGSGTRDPGR